MKTFSAIAAAAIVATGLTGAAAASDVSHPNHFGDQIARNSGSRTVTTITTGGRGELRHPNHLQTLQVSGTERNVDGSGRGDVTGAARRPGGPR